MLERNKIKNVILISVDALRYDSLGFTNDRLKKEKISPNLDNFLAKSVFFDKAYSQGPYTKASFPAIFFSQYSMKVTERLSEKMGWGKLKNEAVSWLDLLNENNYQTVGFSTNPFIGKLMGYHKRFNKLDDRDRPFTFTTRKIFDRVDKKLKALFIDRIWKKISPAGSMDSPYINTLARRYLNETHGGDNFFLWLHYMDVHGPYWGDLRPAKVAKGEEEFDKEKYLKGYYKSIKHLDLYLGDLIKFLKSKGIEEDTMIIFTSDHGELFGEHGMTSHPGKLFNELLHIPLAFYHPSFTPRRTDVLTGNIDIGTTILDLLDLDIPAEFNGVSLKRNFFGKDKFSREVIVSEVYSPNGPTEEGLPPNFAIFDGRYKLERFIKNEIKALYDLERDPKEKNNIWDSGKKIRDSLKKAFKEEYFNG
jgi:arylsulfatase